MKNLFHELAIKRCAKVGHKIKKKKVVVRQDSEWPYVAEDHEAVISYCDRCGEKELWKIDVGKFIEGYTSVSMPKYYWDAIRKDGYVIMEY
jgi:hypothetical protein